LDAKSFHFVGLQNRLFEVFAEALPVQLIARVERDDRKWRVCGQESLPSDVDAERVVGVVEEEDQEVGKGELEAEEVFWELVVSPSGGEFGDEKRVVEEKHFSLMSIT